MGRSTRSLRVPARARSRFRIHVLCSHHALRFGVARKRTTRLLRTSFSLVLRPTRKLSLVSTSPVPSHRLRNLYSSRTMPTKLVGIQIAFLWFKKLLAEAGAYHFFGDDTMPRNLISHQYFQSK